MDVYLAGPQTSWRGELEGHPLLVSYVEKRQLKLLWEGWDTPKFLIDSGAYTVWQQQQKGKRVKIELDDYMRFLHDLLLENLSDGSALNPNYAYFNLDAIPNDQMSEVEANRAAEQSFKNWQRMRENGLDPIGVFHWGEDLDFLDEYVLQGSPLIGLGAGYLRRKRKGLTDWFLEIFERWPRQKFHGLGITNPLLIRYLPFASVDSTTWFYAGKSGPRSIRWLLKQMPSSFYERWNIEWLDPWIEDLCQTRDLVTYRKLGIDAIMSMPRCPEGRMPLPMERLMLDQVEDAMSRDGEYDGGVPLFNLVDRLWKEGTLYDYDRFYNGHGLPPEYDPVNW